MGLIAAGRKLSGNSEAALVNEMEGGGTATAYMGSRMAVKLT